MSATETPEVLTVPEVAEVLRVHESTVRRQIADGTFPLPVLRIGTRTLVSRRALDRYLDGGAS